MTTVITSRQSTPERVCAGRLKVGVVLSHPFHVGLGTDSRLQNQVLPIANNGADLSLISPFTPFSPGESTVLDCVGLNSHPALYEKFYRFSRFAFNQPAIAKTILRTPHYLEWSTNSFARKLDHLLSVRQFDVLLAVHQLAAAACSRVRQKHGVPVVADIHGIWASELLSSGSIMEGSEQEAVCRRFEREA